jgi:hypothetical protein
MEFLNNDIQTSLEPIKNEDQEILSYVGRLLPVFQQLFSIDCNMAVSDMEKFTSFVDGRELLIGEELTGHAVPPEDPQYAAIHQGKISETVISEDVYGGLPCKARALPLYRAD